MRQYAASDVFVFPTRYEGFGIPLLEAMACRVPIVTTNIPVIDEIIKDGQTGVLTKLNDPDDLAQKILLVLRNDELRHRIVDNGRRRVESFYTDRMLAERTEQVYFNVRRAGGDSS
jgi:glycosyltransferase involved in cell wall biosynthesis